MNTSQQHSHNFSPTFWIIATFATVAVFLVGYLLGTNQSETNIASLNQEESVEYTCSMHPSIRQPEPGDCPICGMDLIPATGTTSSSSNAVTLSKEAMLRSGIEVVEVGGSTTTDQLIAYGKIVANESNSFEQASHIGGRIESLLVSSVGERIRKGQKIATMYSPALATAQRELFEAAARKQQQPALYAAAVAKLRNWKLSDKQIQSIESTGKVLSEFPLLSDYDGVIENLHVKNGDHVEMGGLLFSGVSLSTVWVEVTVDASRLHAIRLGSPMSIEVEGVESNFRASVDFVAPIADAATNTVVVRSTLNNSSGLLRPNVAVSVAFPASDNASPVLTVPSSAVLWTGERSVVYVAQTGNNGAQELSLRVVQIAGVTNGETVTVVGGLEAGERIVKEGAFVVDAAAELEGKPSMMSIPEAQLLPTLQLSDELRAQSQEVIKAYLDVSKHLYSDREMPAYHAAHVLKAKTHRLLELASTTRSEEVHTLVERLVQSTKDLDENTSITSLRGAFEGVSVQLIALLERINSGGDTLYEQYCPMVHGDTGAAWLSDSPDVLNPYFGAEMLQCGEVVRKLD